MLTHFGNLDQCLSEISAEIHALNGSVSRIEIALEEDRAARKKL